MKKITPFILIFSLTCSCQTVETIEETLEISEKKSSCEELDWFELGRSDGAQGLASLNWQKRERQCLEFSESDHQAYVNGWYAGVDEFCSESHGFAFGKTGNTYFDVCPTSKEKVFLSAYKKGMRVFNFESDNKKITQELNTLSEAATKADPKLVPTLMKKIGELEGKKEANRSRISRIESEMESLEKTTTTL